MSTADTVFLRAQRMVAEGQGDAGRALVEAELRAAAPGSSRYVEALFWRAALAASAAEAERDYKRIIIEHPLSPWAADALLRLAQLELARGDRARALEHLDRLMLEHPASAARPRTAYWMARVLFEQGDARGACARLAEAERSTPAQDVELRNQVEYYRQRCVGVDTSAVAAADTARSSPAAPDTTATRPTRAAAPDTAAAAPVAGRGEGRGAYTVQVAAYNTRAEAERLQRRLRARGFEARVAGSAKPYRVRIGRYATRAEATEAMRRMQQANVFGFVTEAETP